MVPAAGYPFHSYRVKRPAAAPVARARAQGAGVGGGGAGGVPAHPRGGCGRTSCSAPADTCPARCWPSPQGQRIPAALLEVDAHMGLANRMAAPLVRRVFLAFPIEGLRAAAPPGHRSAGATCGARSDPRARAPRAGAAGRSQGGARVRRQPRRPTPQHRGRAPPGRQTIPASRLSTSPASASSRTIARRAAPHYRVLAYSAISARFLAAADLVVSRAGGSVFEIAAAGAPVDPGAVAQRHRPTIRLATPSTWRTAARRLSSRDVRADRRAAGEPRCPRCWRIPARLEGMGEAARRLAGRTRPQSIAGQLLELAR